MPGEDIQVSGQQPAEGSRASHANVASAAFSPAAAISANAPAFRENTSASTASASPLNAKGYAASSKASSTNANSFSIDTATLIGDSPALGQIREIAASIATRRCTVLILGETGTGKELLARSIHTQSDRRVAPFIPVDCSALTETLFESQLFGHVKGAFTGAVRDSMGFIRAADSGTLFLDEVGELSMPLQAKLLRVIQERAVVPVGDTKPRNVDVRIVCATHRDLRKMVGEGTFREDLYFRLNVVSLNLPPLRERPQDVVPLANHFLFVQAQMYAETQRVIAPDAQAALQNYPWPGNVRELANAIEHAHVLAQGDQVLLPDLPERIRCHSPGTPAPKIAAELCLEDLERRAIVEALRRTNNNKAAAARMLGINIQRLGRRIEKLKVRTAE